MTLGLNSHFTQLVMVGAKAERPKLQPLPRKINDNTEIGGVSVAKNQGDRPLALPRCLAISEAVTPPRLLTSDWLAQE